MIVIPMAGLSSRFFDAGYDKPKYMLEAHVECLFDHAINSFKNYFTSEKFLFISRDLYGTPEFIRNRIHALGIKDYHIAVLNGPTRGQAETVMLGLDECDDGSAITVFNIDTFRPGFEFPIFDQSIDGYLEVFKGEGKKLVLCKALFRLFDKGSRNF